MTANEWNHIGERRRIHGGGQPTDSVTPVMCSASDILRCIKRMGYIEQRYPRAIYQLPIIGMIQKESFIQFIRLPTDEELDAAEKTMAWQQNFFEQLDSEHDV